MNTYFGAPAFGNPSNQSSANPLEMPMAMAWKPPGGAHTNEYGGYNDGSGSKLAKWGHPVAVGDYAAVKNGHQEPIMGQPFTPGYGSHGGFGWNEPAAFQFPAHPQQQDQMMQQTEGKFSSLNLKANVFHPSIPAHQAAPPGHFTPPVELVNNGQWGQSAINQQTPWNLEMTSIPEPANQQQQPQRFRKWDQQREEAPPFNASGYVTPAPYGMHPGYNERMMPGGGAPGFIRPHQRWDTMVPGGGGKFGSGPTDASGPNAQQRGGPAGLFTSGPPPPLHSMGMMPPRPSHIIGHMPPPPLLPALNPPHSGMGNQFQNTFAQNGSNIQQTGLSDDSVWQDPNGDLRKWQRDTGTSIWGDPAKQSNLPIQRWSNFTADEAVAKLAKESEIVEAGWGDLPPIGSNASSTNNGNNCANNSIASQFATQSSQPGQTPQHSQQQQQQHIQKNHRAQGGISGTTGWDRSEQPQQNPPQMLAGQFLNSNQTTPSAISQSGNFMLPPTTTSNAQQQQQSSMFQPPSLLSSMIDSTEAEQQQNQHGGQTQGQKTSPNGQQTKVSLSLAEELSSLGTHHGLGGPIW